MKGLVLVADIDGRRYEIVEGLGEGFYVYRYFGQGPLSSHDYLQDDLEMAKRCAADRFRVPPDAWREAKPEERPAYLKTPSPLSKSQALELVNMELSCIKTERFSVLEDRTLEFGWGWVFLFDSKKYVETQDRRHRSPNRAAFMVVKQTTEMIKSPFSSLRIYYQLRYHRHRSDRRHNSSTSELEAMLRKEWDLTDK